MVNFVSNQYLTESQVLVIIASELLQKCYGM